MRPSDIELQEESRDIEQTGYRNYVHSKDLIKIE